jgi:hypothetical protein
MEAINIIKKRVDKFLGSQSCSRDKISHFSQAADDNKEVLIFGIRLYACWEGCNVID